MYVYVSSKCFNAFPFYNVICSWACEARQYLPHNILDTILSIHIMFFFYFNTQPRFRAIYLCFVKNDSELYQRQIWLITLASHKSAHLTVYVHRILAIYTLFYIHALCCYLYVDTYTLCVFMLVLVLELVSASVLLLSFIVFF